MAITVPAHKLAFMALPKSGCTSVKRALAQVDPDVAQEDTAEVMVWHGVYQTRRFRPDRWDALSDHFRFCVIRDPIKRLMSCYSDLVAQRDALGNSKRLRRVPKLATNPDPDYFFTNFEAYKRRSSVIKHHAISAGVFVGTDLQGNYDRVYKTNEMDELGHDLSVRTGQVVQMPHSNSTRRKLDISDLLDETIDILRPFLDQEYEIFRGYFANPLGPKIHAACAMPV
ncbi:sulfotransferase family 2 domain-containing protein [Sagittula sp. S175]|uniref:sulfotransferase family 2 domain-containing protein n=1 Tax=Sagittula sp. S175 TaxID=3415129 RepID=UPI003C7D66B4